MNRIVEYWATGAVARDGLFPPATQQQIRDFESRFALSLPPVLRQCLFFADGFRDYCRDTHGFRFWPIGEVASVATYDNGAHAFPGAENFYLFCDYLDFSWGYSINARELPETSVYLIGSASGSPIRVAASMDQFSELYIANSDHLYPE
jgi:hypothetical protein